MFVVVDDDEVVVELDVSADAGVEAGVVVEVVDVDVDDCELVP